MLNQVSEAVRFHDMHYTEVMRVREVVLEAANRFMRMYETTRVLPAAALSKAEIALQQKMPEAIGQVIRPYAGQFIEAGMSTAFWAMADAVNFWSDATSSAWPYMTQERRAQSLVWAAEEAAWVQ